MPVPHHSSFYRPIALPDAQPTASKHWRQIAVQVNEETERKQLAKVNRHRSTGSNSPVLRIQSVDVERRDPANNPPGMIFADTKILNHPSLRINVATKWHMHTWKRSLDQCTWVCMCEGKTVAKRLTADYLDGLGQSRENVVQLRSIDVEQCNDNTPRHLQQKIHIKNCCSFKLPILFLTLMLREWKSKQAIHRW